MNKKLMIRATIALMAFVLFWSAVYGVYTIWSNNLPVIVSPAQATMSLVSNSTSVTVGDHVHLIATLSDEANGVSVTFLMDGGQVGVNATSGGGIATCDVLMGHAGSFNFNATCTHS